MVSISVVICAYTMQRWELTRKAVDSARRQSLRPAEVVLSIDDNAELFELARGQWPADDLPEVRVVTDETVGRAGDRNSLAGVRGEKRNFGAGAARNLARKYATGDVIAFLDDDAYAEPDWLQRLADAYSAGVVAVGGTPVATFETHRPSWYPLNYDWIFGCAYFGMPTTRRAYPRLIGANMSVRAESLDKIGGFVGSDFDDLNVCTRLIEQYGPDSIVFEPAAVVHHFVSAGRVELRYFLRRCFFVNREKVRVHGEIGVASQIGPELTFAANFVRYVGVELGRQLVGRRDLHSLSRIGMAVVGLALAGFGHIAGRLKYRAVAGT